MHGASKNKRRELERQIGAFLRQYKRKAQRGREPNDRGYDRAIEEYIRRLRPEELDALLNGEDGEQPARLDSPPEACPPPPSPTLKA
jgi:hypothetical protein